MAIQATSLKLPAELKARVEAAAKVAGTSAHAFMMDAIERETTRSERFAELVHEAREADQEFDRTGSYYDAEDVFGYFAVRGAGKPARRPKLKTWRR